MSRPSYESIDYSLRPAKAVERKMIADLLRRLDRCADLEHYRYIGFGSLYFTDFELFHRSLNIRTMISIEREETDALRFEFNKPFAAIRMEYGEATEVLARLDWKQRSIVWLDYDDALDVAMVNDVMHCATNLRSGSVLMVSARAQLDVNLDERLDRLADDLEGHTPIGVSNEDLGGWGVASTYRNVLDESVRKSLKLRNHGRDSSIQMICEQLINFNYADGVKMMTIGWLLAEESDRSRYQGCSFGDFDFYRASDDAYRIAIPRLTTKEFRHLEERLPESGAVLDATDVGIPLRQSSKFSSIYRYFPRFVDLG